MFKPDFIAYDYETNGLEYYRDDFVVVSASFAWRNSDGEIRTKFIEGQDRVGNFLKKCSDQEIDLVCHNYGFEGGVNKFVYPDLNLKVKADTMRLVQQADSGHITEKDCIYPQKTGLGLEASVSRWLPYEYHNHKEEAYHWLQVNFPEVKKSELGRHLMKLPPDILERYNNYDAVVTLLLYEELTKYLKGQNFDWTLDHTLYMSSADMIIESKGRGVKVNRELLKEAIKEFELQISETYESFISKNREYIDQVIEDKKDAYINCPKVKTERGRESRRRAVLEGKKVFDFNPNSTKDLAALFIGKLGLTPKFLTKPNKKTGSGGGNPSFSSKHMKTWGDSGKILENKGSINFALGQAKNLLSLSEYDGRFHPDLFAVGTVTGRFTGRGNGG